MTLTRAQVTTVQTQEAILADLITLLTGSGFTNINDWTPGTYQNDLLNLAATFQAGGQNLAASVALAMTVPTSTGDWLTFLADGFFNIQRVGAIATQRTMWFVVAYPNGPYSDGPGAISVSFDNNTTTWTNTDAVTLYSQAGFPRLNAVNMVCTVPGALGNVISNATGTLNVSLPNTEVSSINFLEPLDQSAYITIPGQDMQTDQSLQLQCETQWGTLASAETPAARVTNAVISASNGALYDVYVDATNPDGPGTLNVYCADADTVATPEQLAEISGTIQSLFFNGQSRVQCFAPNPIEFGSGGINEEIIVYYVPGANVPNLLAQLQITLTGWISSIPTGGLTFGDDPFSQNVAPVDQLVGLLYQTPLVRSMRITNQSDIFLTASAGVFQKLIAPDNITSIFALTQSLY